MPSARPRDPRNQYRLEPILRTIADRLGDCNLTVSSLASSHRVSDRSLRAAFRSALAWSPKQFIERVRMRQASHLLATTALSVKEIMAACGISEAGNFSRKFKQAFHCSPSAYRDSMRATPVELDSVQLREFCRFCQLIAEITNRKK